MRICDEKDDNITEYGELKAGDIFKWYSYSPEKQSSMMKCNNCYIYLDSSDEGSEPFDHTKVIYYPNACLTLGDPA